MRTTGHCREQASSKGHSAELKLSLLWGGGVSRESHLKRLLSTSHQTLARSLPFNSWRIPQQADGMTNSENVI